MPCRPPHRDSTSLFPWSPQHPQQGQRSWPAVLLMLRTLRGCLAVTRAELEEVARIYREHVDASPTRAVAMLGGYASERTAARRVQQAREAGLLPKTTPGKRRA